jgi:hypothetical protein
MKVSKDLGEINIDAFERINRDRNYNLLIKQVGYNTCFIENEKEDWYTEVINGMYYLYHRNTRQKTNRYHLQEKFINPNIMLEYIHKHKSKWQKKLYKNCVSTVDKMFNKLNKGVG